MLEFKKLKTISLSNFFDFFSYFGILFLNKKFFEILKCWIWGYFQNKRPVKGIETFLHLSCIKVKHKYIFKTKDPSRGLRPKERVTPSSTINSSFSYFQNKRPVKGIETKWKTSPQPDTLWIITFSKQKTRQGDWDISICY